MDIKSILIVCLLWVVGCLVFYKTRRRQITVKQSGDSFQPRDIIEYPKEFTITIVYEKDLLATDIELSDMVIKYADLVAGNYKMTTSQSASEVNNELSNPSDVAPELNFDEAVNNDNPIIENSDFELEFPQPQFEEQEELLTEFELSDLPIDIIEEPTFDDALLPEELPEYKPAPVNISTLEQNFNPFNT